MAARFPRRASAWALHRSPLFLKRHRDLWPPWLPPFTGCRAAARGAKVMLGGSYPSVTRNPEAPSMITTPTSLRSATGGSLEPPNAYGENALASRPMYRITPVWSAYIHRGYPFPLPAVPSSACMTRPLRPTSYKCPFSSRQLGPGDGTTCIQWLVPLFSVSCVVAPAGLAATVSLIVCSGISVRDCVSLNSLCRPFLEGTQKYTTKGPPASGRRISLPSRAFSTPRTVPPT